MMLIDANIALYGFMGSGKTTVGRLLAQVLSRPFIDLDQYIESHNGVRIVDIFESEGEESFRIKEEETVLSMPIHSPHVLALGGGSLLRKKSNDHICEQYRVYTLIVPFSILKERLVGDERPLAPYAESLYKARLKHYQSIGTQIPVSTESPKACMELILETLHVA